MKSEPVNIVEIEVDPLNDHECMSHLISIIRYMSEKEMFPVPVNEQERKTSKLPSWMQSLKAKLMDSTTDTNIKLFLLRLISNTNDVFEPFANHFLVDILSLITTESLWPNGKFLNYFLMDLIVMLLSWSETTNTIPNGNLMERSSASSLLELLMKNLDHPRREIFRYILDVIRVVIELWGTCIQVDYSIVHQLFSKYSYHNNVVVPMER